VAKTDGRFSILSPDGRLLLAPGGLVDAGSGEVVARPPGISQYGGAPAFSRDGALVVCSAEKKSRQNGTDVIGPNGVGVWEAATGAPVARLKTKSWIAQAAFHPDNRFVVTNDLDGVQLRDAAGGEVVARFTMPETVRASTTFGSYAGCLAFSPDGRRMATGHPDGTILVWDARVPPVSVEPLAAKELAALWADLAGADAAKAWQAVGRLAEAPDDALPFLRDRLKPYPAAPADEMRRLLADLDGESFKQREAATKRLKDLGLQAEPGLRAALENRPSLEQKRRVEELLAALPVPTSPPPPDELRQLRALVVLERIGSPEARRILAEMAKGPESARLVRQARAALTAGTTR
jgi:hypothetical protein